MGSSITTIGAKAGKPFGPLPGASFDTGVLLTSAQNNANNGLGFIPAAELPFGYKNIVFQLIPNDMTAGTVTIYVTSDLSTAMGNASNWEPAVAPQTEASFAWTNPLSSNVGQRLLKVDTPFAAFRAVTSADFNGTETMLLITAAP